MEVKTDKKTSDRQYTLNSTEQLCKEHSANEKIMELNIKTNIKKGRLIRGDEVKITLP